MRPLGVFGEFERRVDEFDRTRQHSATELGQHHAARGALEEACSEVLLEGRDAPTGNGLGDTGSDGAGREALPLGDGHERLARGPEVEVSRHACDSGIDRHDSCFACIDGSPTDSRT